MVLLEPGEQIQGVAGGRGGVDRAGSIRKSCFPLRASVPLLSLDGVAKKSSDCHGLTSPRILRPSKAWYGRTPPILLSDVDALLFDSMGSLLSDVGVWSWDWATRRGRESAIAASRWERDLGSVCARVCMWLNTPTSCGSHAMTLVFFIVSSRPRNKLGIHSSS